MLLSATNQFHRISLPAVDAEIMRDHSMSADEMGTLKSLFLWTYTLLMVPGGWLADRVGTRATLLLVTSGSALFGALCGLTGWLGLGPLAAWWWIAVLRGSMGITSAPLYPSTARTVASWFPAERQPLANGLVIAAAGLGIAGPYMVMPWLSELTAGGWGGALLIVGVSTLSVAVLWGAFGHERPGRASRARLNAPVPWKKLLRHRGIVALTLSYATIGYFEYILFYWLRYYFLEILKLPVEQSSTYTAIPNVAFMVSAPLGGWASAWFVRRWGLGPGFRALPMAAMALGAVSLTAGALTGELYLKVVLFSLALGLIGASEGPFWTAAVMLGGPLGATSGGIVNTGGNFLGAFAPYLTPRIVGWVSPILWGGARGDPLAGWTAALIAGSIACLIGMFLWLWVKVDEPIEPDS